jgi:hypothetical protein
MLLLWHRMRGLSPPLLLNEMMCLLGRSITVGATINCLYELGSSIRRAFAWAFIIKQVYDSILQGDGGPKVMPEATERRPRGSDQEKPVMERH